MPDIGPTLREARHRQGLDITDIESATKIRAKYLRALEDEDFDALPGTSYVKSFLRTYAETLGLDARLLVDEYKQRHEHLSDQELRPISPQTARQQRRRGGAGGGRGPAGARVGTGGGSHLARDVLVAVLVVALVGALIWLGASTGDEGDPPPVATPPATTTTATTPRRAETQRRARRPTTVRLQVVPTGEVFVCLRAQGRGALIDGVTLNEGETQPTYRSRRFVIGLGNNAVRLRVNGRLRDVPASSGPVGYSITPSGRRALAGDDIPDCA